MPHPFADFYKGKRVLISGHTSFAGGWLAAWLKLLGAQVCGYGLPPSARPNFFDATLLDRGMTSIFGDLRNREALADTFADFQPEIVIHYAAPVSAERAKADPVDAFASNVMGTVHILEEARQIDSVRAVVIASAHQAESNLLSAAMASAELAVSAYIADFFVSGSTAVATAHSENAIGGGDWAEGDLVPEMVRGIVNDQPIRIADSPVPTLWQHVLDPLCGHLLLAHRLFEQGQKCSGAWDFAPGHDHAMTPRNLAEKFVDFWGEGELSFSSNQRPEKHGTVTKLTCPVAPMSPAENLGWEPSLSLTDAIAWTVDWYKDFYADSPSCWRTTEDQIQRYMKLSAGRGGRSTKAIAAASRPGGKT